MKYERGCFGIFNQDTIKEPPLVLLDGGIEHRCGEKYDFQNDKRPGYEGYLFQYTLEGEGCFEQDGNAYTLKQGKGFLAKMPENSRYWLGDCEKGWEYLYLHFKGSAVFPFAERIRQLSGGVFALRQNSAPVRMIVELQQRLISGERLARYEGGEFLYCFLCAFLRELEEPESPGGSPMIRNAVRLMEEEFRQTISVESIAERSGVSPEHFTRRFCSEMGMTPIKYLTGLKLQAAMNDLLNTNDNLESIALRNGFANGNYFCKVFRKSVGQSPTQYRRQRRYFIK